MPLPPLPRRHSRVQVVRAAESRLRGVAVELAENLTTSEYLQVLITVLGDEIGAIAKYAIREDRHGDPDKPGDLE